MATRESRQRYELKLAHRAARVEVAGRMVAIAPGLQHGTAATYVNWVCRCVACTLAHTEEVAAARARRKQGRAVIDGRETAIGDVKHGDSSTYENHYCRCLPCVEAGTLARRH